MKICKNCRKKFTGSPSWLERAKFCSHKCYWLSLRNQPPWNKGTKGLMKPNKTSFKKGEHRSTETEFKRKGERLGYYGLHEWVYKKFGKAKVCEKCGSDKNIEWANKSFKYKKQKNDWVSYGWGLAINKFPELRKEVLAQ